MKKRFNRRKFLKAVGGAAIAMPFYQTLFNREAHALNGTARRFIVFYFPDGVPNPIDSGVPSLWHATGGETNFTLPDLLAPLQPHRDHLMLLNGLDMGRTDEGSHPGGAQKLLTAKDKGQGQSVDQVLANTVGASMPYRHVYLGVQANVVGNDNTRHISYVAPGQSTPPMDDPLFAFNHLFNGGVVGAGVSGGEMMSSQDLARRSVIDGVLDDMHELRGQLGDTEKSKLDLHLDALREVEQRLAQLEMDGGDPPPQMNTQDCSNPMLDSSGYDGGRAHEPELFPAIARMQIDIMVQAMACGLTKVGVIQNSYHTSELIMSRFVRPSGQAPDFDMRSHQASHYGTDLSQDLFKNFVTQRQWFVEQFAYLIDRLKNIPEGEGSMLDHSILLMCTEVSDGNLHTHSNMPFLVAGGGSGALRPGRLLQFNGNRHGDLYAALGRAMGADFQGFGDYSSGPLPGVLS